MKELTYDLISLSRELLSRDLLYDKLTETEREVIIQEAIQCAEKIATQKVARGLSENNIEEFISQYCTIERMTDTVGSAYSDFTYPRNVIHLYTPNIKTAYEKLSQSGYIVDVGRFQDVFLLHEYFHYLEENEIGSLSKLHQVEVFKFFHYSHRTGIRMASEIGANAFVRSVISSPLDYISRGG